jgi:hypothetical protein
MNYRNWMTGETATVTFFPKGWNDKNQYKVSGVIRDANGTPKFNVEGKWNEKCVLIDIATKKETLIWEMDKITERQKSQYNFGYFALNLNHLNLQLMKDICPTDARLRSD